MYKCFAVVLDVIKHCDHPNSMKSIQEVIGGVSPPIRGLLPPAGDFPHPVIGLTCNHSSITSNQRFLTPVGGETPPTGDLSPSIIALSPPIIGVTFKQRPLTSI